MKVLVVGTRNAGTLADVTHAFENAPDLAPLHSITRIGVCGDVGVDQLALAWADALNLSTYLFSPMQRDMGRHIEWADYVIALWDGTSHNTGKAIETARAAGKALHVHQVTKHPQRGLVQRVRYGAFSDVGDWVKEMHRQKLRRISQKKQAEAQAAQ